MRAELGLPISVGVARTKHLAKIASQVAKPDGLVVVDPGTELEFLRDLPVELIWGVGPVTKARLAEMGVLTIGQLARTPGQRLERLLGSAAAEKLEALALDRDPRASRRTAARDQPERSRRSEGSLPRSVFSYPRFAILRTGSAAGFGQSPGRVEPLPSVSASPTCAR